MNEFEPSDVDNKKVDRRWISWVPFVVALVGVGFLVALWANQDIIDPTSIEVTPSGDGYSVAITWVDDSGREQKDVLLVDQYNEDHTTFILINNADGTTQVAQGFGLTRDLILVVAGISFVIGWVADLSARGFGFVPGTGQFGQTRPVELGEERGFYWRR